MIWISQHILVQLYWTAYGHDILNYTVILNLVIFPTLLISHMILCYEMVGCSSVGHKCKSKTCVESDRFHRPAFHFETPPNACEYSRRKRTRDLSTVVDDFLKECR